MIPICQFFLWFMFYNIVGWIYETLVCSIQEKRLVFNRGFLAGPYCPIYGPGALLDVFLLGWIHNPVLLFFAGMLVNCTLEYLTGWALEEIFHAKWWDYTGWFLNIKGRICFWGALAFGCMSVLLIKWIHPFVLRTTHLLPPLAVYIIAGVLFVIFVTDFVLTNVHIAQFNDKLKDFQQRISGRVTGEKGQNEVYAKAGIEPENNKKLQEITEKLSLRERVMLKNTFSFQSTKYTDLVDRLKDNLGYKQ